MFFPREGTVFVSQAVCRVDGLLPHEMRMTGVGKFAYLSATATELNFGEVQTGDHKTQTFTLQNQSLVNATFKIVPLDEVNPMSSPYFSLIIVPGERWQG